MAKPILFYALAKALYRDGFRVIGVTSEKGRQVYGRDEADAVTHVAEFDVIHRFPPGTSEAYAKASRDRAARVKERMHGGVAHAENLARQARRDIDAAILQAAKGVETHPPPPPRAPPPTTMMDV